MEFAFIEVEMCIRDSYQDGYRKFVEIGPGNVLSKLFKREYDQVETRALQSVTALNEWMKEAS